MHSRELETLILGLCPQYGIKDGSKLGWDKGNFYFYFLFFCSPGEQPRPLKMLAEDKGNKEWLVEEGGYKYQLQPCDQLQKRGL